MSSPRGWPACTAWRRRSCCRAAAATNPSTCVVRGFCRAGVDNVIICPPTFGMYSVAARIQGAEVREVPLDRERGFALDTDRVLAACDANTRIVFLCSPNNPTGNAMDPADVERLLGALAGSALVVVDEAYIEFSGDASLTGALARFPNLVVLRTLSKAFGLAGARVGSLIAAPEIVALLAQGDSALFHSAAHHRGRIRHAVARAARHPARTRGPGARRTRAAARGAGRQSVAAARLAQRREFPARRTFAIRRPRSPRRAPRNC